MNKYAWLRCEVQPGTLGGEVAVLIETADGKRLSIFTPSDFVKRVSKNENEGEISVEVVECDSSFGVVFLPRRTFEGTNVAKVLAGSLSFA